MIDDIFCCSRIWKEEDDDITSKPEIEREEIIVNERFFLSHVICWREFKEWEHKPCFKNKQEKIEVIFQHCSNKIIIYKLKDFDNLMREYKSQLQTNFLKN